MKFLCVSCDEPMKLTEARPPERGSLTVVYSCPGCAHEIAMLTNPYETQVVSSLGVKIGEDSAGTEEASKCPFSGVVQEMEVDESTETLVAAVPPTDTVAPSRNPMPVIVMSTPPPRGLRAGETSDSVGGPT